MHKSVLRSKLRPPRVKPDRIDRPRLFAQLDRGLAGQFTLVSAPAGYGKTTLLTQWARRQTLPIIWFSIDESDNNASVFLEALVSAFQTFRPGCCPRVQALLGHSPLPPVDLIAQELGNDMEDLDDFILILDDFHNIKDARILAGIRTLVYQPPASMRLIVSCRADPMLPLGALRGRGLLQEIRAADLRFRQDEAERFLGQSLGGALSGVQLTSLLEKTEGWPAGLHLAALSLAGRDDLDRSIREFAGSDRYIADYLMEELLGRLDPTVQHYLTATSILERLCAPLCAALLGEGALTSVNGRPVLEWLEESNLFVISLDEQREWFRYHHLFRELLRHRLHATLPAEEVAGLRIRAGDWLSRTERVDEAVDHFLKAHRPDLAAETIEAHRIDAVNREQWRALAAWVDRLDSEDVSARPGLVLVHAWLAHERTDWADLWRHCDRAERLLDLGREPADWEHVLRAEIGALRSQVCYWRADARRSLEYAQLALEGLPAEQGYARSLAAIFGAAALQMLGDNTGALALLTESDGRRSVGPHDMRLANGLIVLGFVMGEVDRPRQLAERLLSRAAAQTLETSTAWAHFHLGTAAYLRNELAEAERHFGQVQPYASSFNAARHSLYGLAWIRQSQGRLDEVSELLDRVELAAAGLNVPLGHEVPLLRTRLAALSGGGAPELALARAVVEALVQGPVNLTGCWESTPVTALAILATAGTDGDLELAERAGRRLVEEAGRTHNVFRSIQCQCLEAFVLERRGRREEALRALKSALGLAAPGRLTRLFAEVGSGLYPLLAAYQHKNGRDHFLDQVLGCFPAASQATGSILETDTDRDYTIDLLLTNRELDVLELLEQRLSNKEIAKQLVISPATVKRHTLSIYSKLGVSGRREAVAKGRRLGLLVGSR